MKLVMQGSRFVAQSSYDERIIPKAAGFRWDGTARVWYAEDRAVAARLAEYADEAAKAALAGVTAAEAPKPEPMRLGIDADGAYRFWCSVDEKDICKAAGFRFENKAMGPRWFTRDTKVAAKLLRYADPETKARIEGAEKEAEETLALSRAADVDVELPCPEGLAYRGFQKAGIAFGADKPAVLIADDMGLGKTIQAVGLTNVDLSRLPADAPYRWLIVCPASLRLNWRQEVRRWLIRDLPIHVVEGRAEQPELWAKVRAEGGVVVINFDVTMDHRPGIDTVEWDHLTVDEAHNLRNPSALRTIACIGGNEEKAKEKAAKAREKARGQKEKKARREAWLAGRAA